MMQNGEIARVFDEVADMLEVAGENFFRVRAYRNAARTIHDHPVALAELNQEQIDKIPGIGADLAAKTITLIQTGELPLHRQLAKKFPPAVMELTQIPGLGPKRVKLLIDQLGIHNRDDLERAAKAGALRTIKGFGQKIEDHVLAMLARQERGVARRITYAEAELIVERLTAHMRQCPNVTLLEVAGSFRRRRETVGDLDLLVASEDSAPVVKQFTGFPEVAEVLGSGETKTTVVLKAGLQIDLRVVAPDSFGAALAYFTGSQAHNIHMRRVAQGYGLLLNEYGLFRDSSALAGKTEEEIFAALHLAPIVPELREDRGEIEAAAEDRLPPLIKRADLRGDLHTHSTYTDGRASIEEMAQAAREAGLEYFAMTDHSQRLTMVHGLDPARVRAQRREIEQIRKRVTGVTLLQGIEVDILEDGSIDLPDDVLAELDWVVASVHYKLEQSPRLMTRRLIKAIRNPYVDVIGHPTGRLLERREPSEYDLGEILRVAREEGCALEINSQPDRLDLTDTACMAAKHAGVKLVVSSDSHSTRDFGLLRYGINQARRGWIERDDVLNTRPLKSLRQRR